MNIKEEWIEDLKEEAREDEIHIYNMKTSFDYFCDFNIESIVKLNEAVIELKKQCEEYNQDFDVKDFIQ